MPWPAQLRGRRRSLVGLAIVALVGVAIVLANVSGDCVGDACPGLVSAPDPGGDETARVPVPPPGIAFGFNDSPRSPGLGVAEVAAAAAAAGANARRYPLDWRLVQPAPGEWEEDGWELYADVYEATLAAEMTPVINFGFAPAWAREPGPAQLCKDWGACRYPPARTMDREWAELAGEVARRFPRAVLQVWNEPNLAAFWRPEADPERFAELQSIAYRAIKEVDRSITVLAAALAPVQPAGSPVAPAEGGDMSLPEFLERAYTARSGISGRFDALGVHPYPIAGLLGPDTLFAKAFADVRSVAASHGDGDLPVWVTETGVPSEGPDALDEAGQAEALLRLYRRLATMDDVAGIFIHRLVVPEYAPPGSRETGYSLLRPRPAGPPSAKPAFCALVAAAGNDHPSC